MRICQSVKQFVEVKAASSEHVDAKERNLYECIRKCSRGEHYQMDLKIQNKAGY